MTYSASGSAAPPTSTNNQAAAAAGGSRPAVVVQTTRPRPFQLARAVIWNPPASSTNSIAGPAPTSFKAPTTTSVGAHPAPPIRSLLSIARPAAPSAPTTSAAAASTPGWHLQQQQVATGAPSHRFQSSYVHHRQQQQPQVAPPVLQSSSGALSDANAAAIGARSHVSFGDAAAAAASGANGAGNISGCGEEQTGRRHASLGAPASRSGIQVHTGTSSSHPLPAIPNTSSGAGGSGAGNSSSAPATAANATTTTTSTSSSAAASAHPLQHLPLRRGKWTKAEEEFAAATIRYFCSGLLNLQFGTLLRGFLAQQLHCHPMRISKKLLPGTTFCGVEISRKLGRRAYSPRWCDSPDATQQKLDAEAHLAQLREAFVASVEEEAAAAGDDAAMQEAKGAESTVVPAKSAAKARRSKPVDTEMESEEEKEAEDLYSRVSNVTMESATSSPHSDTMPVERRAGSPAYYLSKQQHQQPHHHRVFQQLQPQSYHLQQQQHHQQLPYDGRKRSRDELSAVEHDPRVYHNQQQQQAAPFSSRPSYRGAEEAHSRNFVAPMREWQPFQQSPSTTQQQQQQPPIPRSNLHYRDRSGFEPSYYGEEDKSMGNGPNLPRVSYHGAGGGFTERGAGSSSSSVGGAKGASPKQPKLTPPPPAGPVPAPMPFHTYYNRSGYEPSYFGNEEDTIMGGGGANLPLVPGWYQQPYHEHNGNARGSSSSSSSVGGSRTGGAGELKAPPMLPKLPSLRASLQRASTYQPDQQQQQQQQQQQRHMNL